MDPAIDLVLFRDFVEDKRTSMDVYGDRLEEGLAHCGGTAFRVNRFQPTPLWQERALNRPPGVWNMRLSRYLAYPIQARSRQGAVNHVLDHGYAHLLHALDPRRTVVTVHDLIPYLTWHGRIDSPGGQAHRPVLSEFSLRSAKRAAKVVAVSESTRDDLVDHLGFEREKIAVVYNAVPDSYHPFDCEQRRLARGQLQLPHSDKLVLITGWQHYKNHETCLEVFRGLRNESRGLTLVRLGRNARAWEESCRQTGVQDVLGIERLPAERMVMLYNAVDLLLFPSAYEGFGWPALEAMACGTPVVASDAGALREVVGDGGITADARDVASLVGAAREALFNDAFRDDLVARGLRQAGRFSTRRWIDAMSEIYREIHRSRARVRPQ